MRCAPYTLYSADEAGCKGKQGAPSIPRQLSIGTLNIEMRIISVRSVLQMKRDAEANKEPPVYTGKWSSASKEEVDEMFATGAKPAYRFRVPKDKTITVPDAIRGDVSWNTDTLGDFIILRSDGSPVYNFCVAIDDALMKISHVIRAEEHLPNTLRQVGTCSTSPICLIHNTCLTLDSNPVLHFACRIAPCSFIASGKHLQIDRGTC